MRSKQFKYDSQVKKQTIKNYNTNCRVIKIKYGHDGLNMTIVRVYINGFIFPYAEKKFQVVV